MELKIIGLFMMFGGVLLGLLGLLIDAALPDPFDERTNLKGDLILFSPAFLVFIGGAMLIIIGIIN